MQIIMEKTQQRSRSDIYQKEIKIWKENFHKNVRVLYVDETIRR